MQQLMPYIGLIYDVCFLILFTVATVRSWRQGLLAGVADLAGTLLGTLGGLWGANRLAPIVYRELLREPIAAQVGKALQNAGGDAAAVAEQLSGLPQALRNAIVEVLGQNAAALPEQVADALEPVLLPFLQVVLFLLFCAALRWVCAMVVRLLRHVNDVPLLGGLNRLLGLVLGLVVGLLDCWLLSMLLWVLGCTLGGLVDLFSFAALGQSTAYGFFEAWNPFLGL